MRNSYYNYVEEHKLLIECLCGEIEFEDVVELKNEIEANLKEVAKINILIDIQEDISKTPIEKIDEFIQFYLKSEFISKIDCIAIVTNTPSQVAKTILIMEGLKELNVPTKVFSSIDSAINWLNTGIDLNRVKSILKNFKNTLVLN